MKSSAKLCPELARCCRLTTKKSLSPRQRYLLEMMQAIHFGRMENIVVHDGQPLFDPPPKIIREIKFGGENEARKELNSNDFLLKTQVVELFKQLEKLGDGTVLSLEIKHGLPFRMTVEEPAA